VKTSFCGLPHPQECNHRALSTREAANRAVEAFARELETDVAPPPETEAEICGCFARAINVSPAGGDVIAMKQCPRAGIPSRFSPRSDGRVVDSGGVENVRGSGDTKRLYFPTFGTPETLVSITRFNERQLKS